MISSGTVVFCLFGLAAAGYSYFDRQGKPHQEHLKQVRTVFGNKVPKRFPYAFEKPAFQVMDSPVAKLYSVEKVLPFERPYEFKLRKPYHYVKRNKPYVESDESDTLSVNSEYPLRVQAENESPYKVFKDLKLLVNVPVEKKYPVNAHDEYESSYPSFEDYKVPVEFPVDKLPFDIAEKRIPYAVENKVAYPLIKEELSAMNVPYKIITYGGNKHEHTLLQNQIIPLHHQEQRKPLKYQDLGLGAYYSGPEELNFYQQAFENRDGPRRGPHFGIKPKLRNIQESRIEEQNPHDYYLRSGVKRHPLGERSYSMYSVFEDNQETIVDNKEPIQDALLSNSGGSNNPNEYESVYIGKPTMTDGPSERTNIESKTRELQNVGQHYVFRENTADDSEMGGYRNRYESFKGCEDRFCPTGVTNSPLGRNTHLHSPVTGISNGKLSGKGSDGIEQSGFVNNNVILTSNNSAKGEAIAEANSHGFDVKTNIMVST